MYNLIKGGVIRSRIMYHGNKSGKDSGGGLSVGTKERKHDIHRRFIFSKNGRGEDFGIRIGGSGERTWCCCRMIEDDSQERDCRSHKKIFTFSLM